MNTIELNKLPVPTFGHLGVNSVWRGADEKEAVSAEQTGGCIDISEDTVCTITARSGETVSAVQYIGSDKSLRVKTEISAACNSSVSLIQVFAGASPVIAQLKSELQDNAALGLTQIYIGGEDTVSEISAELRGRASRFDADIAYTLGGRDHLDINLIADHYGKKSVSEISAGGVLNGAADKVFKGTIDFKSGASASKGHEIEDVLLIGDSVRSRTVPVILCAEEDVEGSHGATAGRIDERQIFYMRSRGIPEEEILRIMARAKLSRQVERIGDEETKRRVFEALGWGDIND